MSFDNDKYLKASRKDVLIRIEQRYDFIDLAYDATSGKYKTTTPFVATDIKEDGVSRSFYYVGNDIYVTLNAAPNYFSNPVVGYRYIYLTNTTTKFLDKDDPTGAISNMVEWKPLLLSVPTISQTSKDLLDGNYSIDASSFSCTTLEGTFDTRKDISSRAPGAITYYLCDCDIWFGVNGNYKYVFKCKIQGTSEDGEQINFDLTTSAKAIFNENLMGDARSEAFKTLTGFHTDKIVPFYYHTALSDQQRYTRELAPGVVQSYYEPIFEQLPEPIPNSSTSPTKNFFLGRYPGPAPSEFTLPFIAQAYNDQSDISTVHNTITLPTSWADATEDVRRLINIGSVVYVKYSDGSYPTSEYKSVVIKISGTSVTISNTSVGATPGTIISSIKRPSVTLVRKYKDTNILWSVSTRDLTFYNTVTAGGNYIWRVSGVNWGINEELLQDDIRFIAYYDTYTTIGNAAKAICQKAGFTVNTSSFTTIDTRLADRYFIKSIPSFKDSSFPTVLESLQLISKSNLMYFFFDKNDQINAKSFIPYENIAGTQDYELDDSHMLSVPKLETVYDDIKSYVKYKNEFIPDRITTSYGYYTYRGPQLYGTDRIMNLDHCNDTDIPIWYHYYSSTKKNYWSLTLPFEFCEIEIGELIKINSKYINGEVDTYLLVLGYNKSIENITIECLEYIY